MRHPATSPRFVLLGTGTCQLQAHRRASSVLLELGNLRIVYDFGRGIADRLAALGLRQDDVSHVVLSHFHPDHVSDLVPYLHAASWSRIDARTRDLHLWGPRGIEVQMARILGLFGPDELTRRAWRVHVHEVREPTLTIEDHRFDWRELPPSGNHGLRFEHQGRVVALTGDSGFHDAEVEFLADVDLAIFDSGHLTDDEIVELAVRSRARRLVASHVYRELDTEALVARARARGFSGELLLGADGMAFALDDLESRPRVLTSRLDNSRLEETHLAEGRA
ncbi:MAG: ribonuclease Z [Acidobacteriota bacterium]